MKVRRIFRLLLAGALVPGLLLGGWNNATSKDMLHNPSTIHMSGRVTDAATGVPITGAYMEVKDPDGVDIVTTSTDPDGNYSFDVIWQETYSVCSSAWGENGGYGMNFYLWECTPLSPGSQTEIQLNFQLRPAGNLILEVYDSSGNLVRNAGFLALTAGYIFATSLSGDANGGRFFYIQDAQGSNPDLGVPAAILPIAQPSALHVLWTVPSFGQVFLDMDNGGQGYRFASVGDYLVLNFNREAAQSETSRLQRELSLLTGQGYSFSSAVGEALTLAQAALADGIAHLAAIPPATAEAVQDFDNAIRHSLVGQETLSLERAEADIPHYRQGTLQLNLTENGKTMTDTTITFRQINSDFHFGAGYQTTNGWDYNPQVGDLMEQMGINATSVMLEHSVFEPQPGVFDWSFLDEHSGLDTLIDKGFRVMGALAYYGSSGQTFDCPSYWQTMTYSEYKQHLFKHFKTVAGRYGTRISPWMINEQNLPWSNCLGLTWEQKMEIFQVVMDGLEAGHSGAQNLVTSLAIPYGWAQESAPEDPDSLAGGVSNPVYLQWLAEKNLHLDNIGLEYHFFGITVPQGGGYLLPGMTLAGMARLMDIYDNLGVPIWIEPFQVPAQQEPGSAWWRRPWDEATQAELSTGFYKLAFSRKNMHTITWGDVTDTTSFVVGAGLIDTAGRPKQAYYALKDLIASWKTSGNGKSGPDGSFVIHGFAGDYEVTIVLPGGEEFQTRVHVREQEENTVDITIHRAYLPAIGR
jgi:hypothetical protein